MFVLGIDPGLSRCGYCCVEARATGPRAAALGVITTLPADPLPQRLAELQAEIQALLDEFSPSVVAVERVLFQVNVRTAMSVGQASGVAMAAAAAAGCEVIQYSPNQVKEAVAGYGAASKEQVQRMVQTLLGLTALPEPPDAADAAALALTHLALAGAPRADAVGTAEVSVDAPRRAGQVKNAAGRVSRVAASAPAARGGAR